VATKKSGGSGTTWLLVGGGVAAAGAGAVVLLGKKTNKPPTPGTISVTPGFSGIASATEYTFADNGASDPDGDPLAYTWNFGDGNSAQGQTVKHVFASPSSFTVSVNVTDGKGGQSTPTPVSVTVRSLSGIWQNQQGNITRIWNIQQSGTTLNGSYTSNSCGTPGTVTGTARNPRNVLITASISCYPPFDFDGVADDAVNNLTGNAGGVQLTFTRTQ